MNCPRCNKCFVKVTSFKAHLKSHGLSNAEITAVLDAVESEPGQPIAEDPIPEEIHTDGETEDLGGDEITPEEENGGNEAVDEIQPSAKKRKITINRPFGIRKKRKRGRHGVPKVVVASPETTITRRKRSPRKPGPVDPVRKSSRQRGVQIDAGLPMYPAPKQRSKGTTSQDEPDAEAAAESTPTLDPGIHQSESELETKSANPDQENPENENVPAAEPESSITLEPGTSGMNEKSSEAEPDGQNTIEPNPKNDIDTKHVEKEVVESKIDNGEDGREVDLQFDSSFIRGAKADMSLSLSPIPMNSIPASVFTSTPMPQRLTGIVDGTELAVETTSLDCSLVTNVDSINKSTFDITTEEMMNTTYTIPDEEGDTVNETSFGETQVEDK